MQCVVNLFSQAHPCRQSSPWPQRAHAAPGRRGRRASSYNDRAAAPRVTEVTGKARSRAAAPMAGPGRLPGRERPAWRRQKSLGTSLPGARGSRGQSGCPAVRGSPARGTAHTRSSGPGQQRPRSPRPPHGRLSHGRCPQPAQSPAAPGAARAGAPRLHKHARGRWAVPSRLRRGRSRRPAVGARRQARHLPARTGTPSTRGPRSLPARAGNAARPPPLPLLRTGRAPQAGRGRGRAAGGGAAGGQLRPRGERLRRGPCPCSQGRMEAEGRAPGSPLLAGGEGPGADSRPAAGAPGTARGPLIAAAEVLALDDEEDDLEVFSKDTSLAEVNSFSPSMPISPSSMINQYKFEDGPELRDLFITVDDPESHITAIETFITYRVVTKTSRGEFDSSEYEVRRRYQDFLWLKSKLEEAHPTLIIPPLPEKFIMKGMVERFSDEFIETRRKALHKFLNRIADHPTLTFNEDFKIFLTAQAWELSSHKKQGPGLLSRMGQTVRAVASSVRGAVKNRPGMFTEINDYMGTFSQKINLLDKIAHRIYKEERDYFNEMKEYGPIHTLWSASEEDLADSLKGIASCIDRCCKATEKRMAGLSENLLPILHEYVLYSEILMGVLKRRDQIQGELDSKVDALANRKTEKDLFSEETGKLEDKVERANNALKADWDRWKQNMQCDMRSTFTNVAENNLRFYEECLATWESFLASQTVDLHVEEDSEDRP
ncbi:sorting nexin-7 isoform X1 [Corapipo altera]|uniref:sorting nexin-7 isoform X1 n=1 Tax=Corapipo altera TaxID=415028 RepID=UPI000FD667A6|nr:sorting nexin-7 isoform X1 [Corapipo altera]